MYTRGTRSTVNHLQSTNLQLTQYQDHHPSVGHKISQGSRKGCSDILLVEKKLATRLLSMIFLWLLGWTPFALIALVQLNGYGLKISKYISLAAMMFCKTSSVVNAFIYGMRYYLHVCKVSGIFALVQTWPLKINKYLQVTRLRLVKL